MLSQQKKLQAFLDECLKSYPIDPKKLVVLGFSQGGVMAYSLALSESRKIRRSGSTEQLAAERTVAATERQPRGAIIADVGAARHSRSDDRSRAREKFGGDAAPTTVPLTYREYPMGHEIGAKSLAELSAWLEEKVIRPVISL